MLLRLFTRGEGFAQAVPPGARGLTAFALVELAAREPAGTTGRDEAFGLAEAAVRRTFRDTPEAQLVSQMPWLGWAELRLARLRNAEVIPAAVGLRDMRAEVWKHQITALDDAAMESRGGLPDTVGAIAFGTGGSTLGATWQTAQAVAFMPAMLMDPRLTKREERPLELAKLVAAIRFIRQLQADESAGWMFPNRPRYFGGVRGALWDQRMPHDASSMSLIAITELMRALGELTKPAR